MGEVIRKMGPGDAGGPAGTAGAAGGVSRDLCGAPPGARVVAAAPACPEVMATFESTGFTPVGIGERMGLALEGGEACAPGPGVWALAGLDRG